MAGGLRFATRSGTISTCRQRQHAVRVWAIRWPEESPSEVSSWGEGAFRNCCCCCCGGGGCCCWGWLMKAWFIRGPTGPMPCRKMVAASIGRFGIVQRLSMVDLDLAQVSEDPRVLESRAQHGESRGLQVGQRVRGRNRETSPRTGGSGDDKACEARWRSATMEPRFAGVARDGGSIRRLKNQAQEPGHGMSKREAPRSRRAEGGECRRKQDTVAWTD